VIFAAVVTLPLGFVSMFAGCASTKANTTRPRVGVYQPKGVGPGQIESRSKAGETNYSMVRFVPRDCQDGEPVPCGDYSTVVVDSRKNSTLAGSFSGTVEITTEHTFIEIRGGKASTVGTGQIKAQGEADATRIGAVGEAVGSVPSSMSCYSAMKRWGSRDW